jgi:hypothetical protein
VCGHAGACMRACARVLCVCGCERACGVRVRVCGCVCVGVGVHAQKAATSRP